MVSQISTEDTPWAGGGGVGGETVGGLLAALKSPPLTIFRIVHPGSKYPNRIFTCVTSVFLISGVNSDIKCPQSGQRYLLHHVYSCKNLGRHVQLGS